MKIFLIALVFEFFTALGFFRWLSNNDTDGNIGFGLLFWLMVAVYLLIDAVWGGILIWKAVHL